MNTIHNTQLTLAAVTLIHGYTPFGRLLRQHEHLRFFPLLIRLHLGQVQRTNVCFVGYMVQFIFLLSCQESRPETLSQQVFENY
jgi:hypothetical protein